MNEFTTWTYLATYGGVLAAVLAITQATKGLGFVKKIPTCIWSYILALIILYPATYFTGQLTLDNAALILVNGVFVSLAANGGFDAAKRATGISDGTLRIDSSNPDKDIYRLDLGDDLDKIGSKSKISLKIDPEADLSQK